MNVRPANAMAEARRLVVEDGQTYAQAAEAVGIPLSTIQKAASREEWQKGREGALSYGQSVKRVKALALAKAIASLESGQGDTVGLLNAWRALETAYPESRYAKGLAPGEMRDLIGHVVMEIVEFLSNTDRNALTALAPHIRALGVWLEEKFTSAAVAA